MRFENRFDVDAPLETVWDTVLDVERVAPTVPGAQVLERTGEDAYKVAIKVKVGPMSMTYRGEVEITERDEAAHRAVMKARAKESRGQGMADADVTMVLSGDGERTSATVTTEVELSGKVASMGQGVLQEVSGRLVRTFADNLAAMLGGQGAAAGGEVDVAAAKTRAEMASPAGAPSGGEAGVAAAKSGDEMASAAGLEAAATAEVRPLAGATPGGGETAGAAPRPSADALDLGSIGGALVTERLRDPRVLGALLAVVAAVSYLLGRRAAG